MKTYKPADKLSFAIRLFETEGIPIANHPIAKRVERISFHLAEELRKQVSILEVRKVIAQSKSSKRRLRKRILETNLQLSKLNDILRNV